MSIWTYRTRLPAVAPACELSLGEGATPLLASKRIGPAAGLHHLYFKLETVNPSGSYKDRFAAAAVSQMLSQHKTRCMATSSGNTGSALAAYCAAAGIACHIAVVETAPQGKLLQMLAYGAQIFRVQQFGLDPEITTQVFDLLSELGARPGVSLEISAFKYSPLGMSGVKTVAFELAAQLPAASSVFVPAGGGGLCLAIATGYEQLQQEDNSPSSPRVRSPRVHCVQPAGNDTIASALRAGSASAKDVTCTSTISGLQVPTVIDGDEVIAACKRSGGNGHVVDDEEIYAVQRRLAREEGVFCEPAAAVSVAGALAARKRGELDKHDQVVCVVTGSGFKDGASLERMASQSAAPTLSWRDIEGFVTRE